MPKAQFSRFSLAALNDQSDSTIPNPNLSTLGKLKKRTLGERTQERLLPTSRRWRKQKIMNYYKITEINKNEYFI